MLGGLHRVPTWDTRGAEGKPLLHAGLDRRQHVEGLDAPVPLKAAALVGLRHSRREALPRDRWCLETQRLLQALPLPLLRPPRSQHRFIVQVGMGALSLSMQGLTRATNDGGRQQ